MTNATVSVVIAARNCARFLPDAISSCRYQTIQPVEIIVVDDGSTDNTRDVLKCYESEIVAVYQKHSGVSVARNTGIDLARGDFVAILDADDISAPDRLERQLRALQENNQAIACYARAFRVDVSGHAGEVYPEELPPGPVMPSTDFLTALVEAWRFMPINASAMFRRLEDSKLRYPVDVSIGEDMLFGAMLRTRGSVVRLREPLYGYRMHGNQTTPRFSTIQVHEQRLAWVRANAITWCPEKTPTEVTSQLWALLSREAEHHYWRRRKQQFLEYRDYLQEHWPKELPSPSVCKWKWYPDLFWNLRNWWQGKWA